MSKKIGIRIINLIISNLLLITITIPIQIMLNLRFIVAVPFAFIVSAYIVCVILYWVVSLYKLFDPIIFRKEGEDE